jgi:hypothetical protein
MTNESPPIAIETLNQAQRERLAYIDFRLYFFGEIGRPDLMTRFGVAPAGATRDLALYRELAPENITFDGSSKIYRIGDAFVPRFDHPPQRVLTALAQGFGDGASAPTAPLLPCESPAVLSQPPLHILAPVCRAIYGKRPLAIRYHSMSSGASERVIVPFALVDTGLRWHARAFDRKSGAFRDFVLTRIEAPTLLTDAPQPHENGENDIQWTRIVELPLVPHPRLAHPETVRMDYGMTGDVLRLRARAAVAGYMLLRWGVDCSPDHHLPDSHYRLWLADPLTLYGVESAALAPGYQPPQT